MNDTIKGLILGVMMVFLVAWSGSAATSFSTMKLEDTTREYMEGAHQVVEMPTRVVGDAKSYCVAITGADADFTLATTSHYFNVCSYGNDAYLTFKDTAPAVSTAVNGYDVRIHSGSCMFLEIEEDLAAVIGSTAAGVVCFYPKTSPGGTP